VSFHTAATDPALAYFTAPRKSGETGTAETVKLGSVRSMSTRSLEERCALTLYLSTKSIIILLTEFADFSFDFRAALEPLAVQPTISELLVVSSLAALPALAGG
jgi:hypothetical protein